MNFNLGSDEYYLQPGDQVELPEHPHIQSLVRFNHIELIDNSKLEKKDTKTSNEKK